jgi:hypothetical protein
VHVSHSVSPLEVVAAVEDLAMGLYGLEAMARAIAREMEDF